MWVCAAPLEGGASLLFPGTFLLQSHMDAFLRAFSTQPLFSQDTSSFSSLPLTSGVCPGADGYTISL